MAKHNIKFFGHCYDEENNNDKIWGWVEIEGKLYNFWGRRATDAENPKKLSFKRHPSSYRGEAQVEDLARKKMRGGSGKSAYKRIALDRDSSDRYVTIESIYPEFTQHFLRELTLFRLGE